MYIIASFFDVNEFLILERFKSFISKYESI